MVDRIILDMTKANRRKKRSKADIKRFWNSRYHFFLKSGFSEDEATWGADNGLSVRDSKVKDLAEHRKGLIKILTLYNGMSRAEAIKEASKDLEHKLDKAGEEELNLFYEVSP